MNFKFLGMILTASFLSFSTILEAPIDEEVNRGPAFDPEYIPYDVNMEKTLEEQVHASYIQLQKHMNLWYGYIKKRKEAYKSKTNYLDYHQYGTEQPRIQVVNTQPIHEIDKDIIKVPVEEIENKENAGKVY